MRNTTIITISALIIIGVIVVPLDLYANNLVQTNVKENKQVYDYFYINHIQMGQFMIIGIVFGMLISNYMIRLNEFLIKRKEKAKSNDTT